MKGFVCAAVLTVVSNAPRPVDQVAAARVIDASEIAAHAGQRVTACGRITATVQREDYIALLLDTRTKGVTAFALLSDAQEWWRANHSSLKDWRACGTGDADAIGEASLIRVIAVSELLLDRYVRPPLTVETPGPTRYSDTEAADLLVRFNAYLAGASDARPNFEWSRLTDTQFEFFSAALDSAPPRRRTSPPPQRRTSADAWAPVMNQLGALIGTALAGGSPNLPASIFAPTTAGYTSKNTSINDVSKNGEVVTMMDGSVWEVYDVDRQHSALWLTGQVSIVKGERLGEYLLTRNGRTVRAKQIR